MRTTTNNTWRASARDSFAARHGCRPGRRCWPGVCPLLGMGLVLLGLTTFWSATVRAADVAADSALGFATQEPAGAAAADSNAGAEAHTDAATEADSQPEPAPEPAAEGTSEEAEAQPKLLPWPEGLEDGRRRAMAQRKPILVRAGAEWCPSCRALAREIARPEVQKALGAWTLVYVDVEHSPEEARRLAISATPTLKILTPTGRPVAAHIGLLSAEELIAWLDEHRKAALAAADLVLLAEDRPSMLAVVKLLGALGDRDPAVRRAAMGRLAPYPDIAGGAVLKTLREGTLAQRLSALGLFETWGAPIEGLDPWQPDSVSAERLARLEEWLDGLAEPPTASPEQQTPQQQTPAKLTDEQLAEARLEIERMLRADEAEAAAIRQRLARFGPALAEEIDRLLEQPADDRQLERLRALRYRLAAVDSLELRWPGGLDRLAATDTAERRAAAAQLVELAVASDQALFMLLFADADPLVRELSLRGLQRTGGARSTAVLAGLLADPEPNVRAAVLKLLEENPQPAMVPKVAEYLKTETDPDLIVHAVRFLRAAGGPTAQRAMLEKNLVEHESWQVRAEVAAGLGKDDGPFSAIPEFSRSFAGAEGDEAAKLRADTYAELISLLDDPDAFVVSRAVEGLSRVDLAVAVEPLVKAATKHPELAVAIVETLAQGEQMRPKAVPHLRRFATHEDSGIRAAAIRGLVEAVPASMEKELAAALADEESQVRIAGASALLVLFDRVAGNAQQEIENRQEQLLHPGHAPFGPVEVFAPREPSAAEVLGEAVRALFGAKREEPVQEAEPQTDETPDQTPAEPEPSVADLLNAGPEWDRWLEDFYQGKGRPRWADAMVEPLRKMLTAQEPRERMVAAAALVPLGHVDEALPVVHEALRSDPNLGAEASSVLMWLTWEARLQMFEKLRPLVKDHDSWQLVENLAPVADQRAAEVMWKLLGDEEEGRRLANPLEYSLKRIYRGTRYGSLDDLDSKILGDVLRAVRPRAEEGSFWQATLALLLMLEVAPDEAAAMAKPLADDPSVEERLRQAAFQIYLAGSAPEERLKVAIESLQQNDPFRVRLAVGYLALGPSRLAVLQVEEADVSLSVPIVGDGTLDPFGRSNSAGPIIPQAPKGLKPEHVRPLLDHEDPALAAQAGYLLALMGDEKGLEPLLRVWRKSVEEQQRDYDLDRLVYRAVAILNDSSQIDVLRTIRKSLDDYRIREFYWTIRIMSGPEVIQLRDEIRDEVGLERLR